MGGKIKYPKFDFDCEGVRFKHRFMAFMKLSAFPIVTYEQYKVLRNLFMYHVSCIIRYVSNILSASYVLASCVRYCFMIHHVSLCYDSRTY